LHATEAYHTEEVFDAVLPADYEPTEVMQPSEEAFHPPTLTVTPQGPTVLCRFTTQSAMRRYHLDSIAVGKALI